MNDIICPYCHTHSQHGVRVCIGCQAEIAYGPTGDESQRYGIWGLVGGIISTVAILKTMGLEISFGPIVGGAIAGAIISGILMYKFYDGKVRFFRRFLTN